MPSPVAWCDAPALLLIAGAAGTGKSTLAGALRDARALPVIALDDVLASGGMFLPPDPRGVVYAAELLLLRLAARQLATGQSVIVDTVAGALGLRSAWRRLARQYRARFVPVVCICTDGAVHRAHIVARGRGTVASAADPARAVALLRAAYAPWYGRGVVADALDAPDVHVRHVLAVLDAMPAPRRAYTRQWRGIYRRAPVVVS